MTNDKYHILVSSLRISLSILLHLAPTVQDTDLAFLHFRTESLVFLPFCNLTFLTAVESGLTAPKDLARGLGTHSMLLGHDGR